ncbi:MAG: alpha/beta hydrolase fold domain-containing protein, partial [Bacteroidota bacterium]
GPRMGLSIELFHSTSGYGRGKRMPDGLTTFMTRLAGHSPWVVMPAVNPPWTLYGFRRAGAGPYRCEISRGLVYADGPLRLDLYRPAGAHGQRPGVLLLHGGGWVTGSRALHRGFGRLLATHGFVAAAADYHLLGKAPWPACLEDCRSALSWMRARAGEIGLAPERLALLGDSAGAHLAAMLGIELGGTPLTVRGVVSFFGPFDLTAPADLPWPRRCQEKLLGGPLSDPTVQDRARALSPVAHVTAESPPFLLIHGAIDRIVPPSSSTRMAAALTRAGVPVELVAVSHADHGLFALGRIEPAFGEIDRIVVAFLQKITEGVS